ncbi:MAG: DNA-binding protein [Ignavibacteria bacterium]|nr:DNA-binding protein [Ignavibacteria bacterium]MBI3765853.1 DNA-binding protein [Ignavibacteriales bacterium]
MGQLPYGADLLESLTHIVQKENIRLGRISALGATTHAVVAYYDQDTKQYNPLEFKDGMEILNLHGNVSMRDGKPFVHIHILLGDAEGKVFGGHVMPGTKLFACEISIDEIGGEELARAHDERTGLYLWRTGYLA